MPDQREVICGLVWPASYTKKMNDLPPPYSPPSPRPAVATPQVVLESAPTLPPSYDDATSAPGQPIAITRPRARSSGSQTSASPSSPSYLSTSPGSLRARLSVLRPQRSQPNAHCTTTSTKQRAASPAPRRASAEPAIKPAVLLTPYERQRPLLQVLRRVPWRRSMGDIPATPEDALYEVCLLASEAHVQPILDIGTPITYTDRFAAVKKANGSALHGALLGAAPHLAEYLTQVFWGRVYSTALEEEAHTAEAHGTVAAAGDQLNARAVAIADEKTRALLDGRDAKGCTPMHIAGQVGATDAVRIMLRRGAELDCVDDLGRTPLHMAARYGREETADLLVGLGASTGHLMPRASEKADAAYGWSEYDDVDSLWFRARGDRLADLGNYQFVTRFIGTIVAKNRKRGLLDDAKDTSVDKLVPAASMPVRAAYEGSSRSAVDGARHARESVSSTSLFVHGSGRRRPSASVADPYELSVPSASAKGKVPQDRWRRTGTEFAVTPEYVTWKDGLDKLQDEHRAQLERNKKAEIPEGYGIVDAAGLGNKNGK
ncbi:ankyrin repeat protein [Ophiostoma piceae UAMH 11346]|uniref:protein S-acyltransferase n=1 Tax=Ophiostoma piceae (strain UAMH 11346) TaxID=1262450 RepID=S3CJD7_OPHP1|nr:ankyrin repeat protein [Ophiostoma piceae UAMH 11346]